VSSAVRQRRALAAGSPIDLRVVSDGRTTGQVCTEPCRPNCNAARNGDYGGRYESCHCVGGEAAESHRNARADEERGIVRLPERSAELLPPHVVCCVLDPAETAPAQTARVDVVHGIV